MKGVVYRVPCMDCHKDETGRSLQKRLVEHRAAVKRSEKYNAIAVHAWEHGHRVDWDYARVLRQESVYWRRRTLEAIEIRRHGETTNVDCGLMLSPYWTGSCLTIYTSVSF
jgi:hypothetical protein